MPKFFKENLFAKPNLDPEHELESALDTPELPPADPNSTPDNPQNPPFDQSLSSGQYPQDPNDLYWDDDILDQDTLYNSVQTLLSWKAVARPFRKKDRSYYTTVLILVVLISLIAFLAGEKLLIGVLLALLFLIYVLNFVPPDEIEYKLSTQGIIIKDQFYHWYELDSFWFSEKEGFKILNVLTSFRFPGLLIIVLGADTHEEEVKRICARYLPFHEIAPKSQIEKWTEALQKHFPLENPHK